MIRYDTIFEWMSSNDQLFNYFTTALGGFRSPESITLTMISGVFRPSQRLGPDYLESA